MKNIYLSFLAFMLLGVSALKSQGCDPAINGFSFSIADCLYSNTSVLTVEWAMSGDPGCVAPEGSFAIQINLPASGVYGVNSVADVTASSDFDWTLLDAFTLEGINNVDIDWLDEGDIEVLITPLSVNACVLLESNSNIAILPSGPPFFGSPGSFDNDDTNDTQFDQIGVNSVVPVRLTSFDVQNIDCNQNRITWATASEVNNEGFEIQRSMDGTDFRAIGFVEPLNASANGEREYSFTDDELTLNGNYYYRIKQIDYDGQFEIFEVKGVKIDCAVDINVALYPNPAVDKINLDFSNAFIDREVRAQIYTSDGRLAKTITKQANGILEHTIDISDLDAGMYRIRLNSNLETIEENFIKID